MTNGIGRPLGNLLFYPVLIMSVIIAIVSAVLLIFKGKQLNKNMKIHIIVLLIIALSVTLFLVIIAIAFGNRHSPAPPVSKGK